MYTLNIKDLKLKPAIPEEKAFTGEDRERISSDAADYIKSKYKNIYNPITVERMTREIVRDEKGETQKEKWARENNESHAKVKAEVSADSKLRSDVWEKHKPELKENTDEEWDQITAVQNEYEKKIKDAANSDVASDLEEEMNLKIDDIKLKHQKIADEIENKINTESKRDWAN